MSDSKSVLNNLAGQIARLFQSAAPQVEQQMGIESGAIVPLTPRVLMIIYNPVVDPATGKKLIETMNWSDPDKLAAGFIADVDECSGGLVKYQITQRIEADEVPVKVDGLQYTTEAYLSVAQTNQGAHSPDTVDYATIVTKFNLLQHVTANEFDEVWMFGGPYFGFWESVMGGAGAFFCNANPLANTATCPRKFVIMGFNYQRGIGEMLEDLGHRAEAVLARLFNSMDFLQFAYTHQGRGPRPATNLYERYMSFDILAPGKSNVGSLHYAPNSLDDYQWGVTTPVQSCADDWLQFPNLPDPPNYRTMTTQDWGGGDIRLHHKWWLKHLPKVVGTTNGIANNWWKYFIDPNNVK